VSVLFMTLEGKQSVFSPLNIIHCWFQSDIYQIEEIPFDLLVECFLKNHNRVLDFVKCFSMSYVLLYQLSIAG
jgi:hypothetical protein